MNIKDWVALISGLFIGTLAQSAPVPPLHFQPEVEVEGRTLSLNGAGIKEETIFNIDSFAAALYLESPSSNPNQILGSNEIKTLRVRFLRDFSSTDVRYRWREMFQNSCISNCDSFNRALRAFNDKMPSVKKNQEMIFQFLPNRVEVYIENERITDIADKSFADTLLRSWIAPPKPDSKLYQALLQGLKNKSTQQESAKN